MTRQRQITPLALACAVASIPLWAAPAAGQVYGHAAEWGTQGEDCALPAAGEERPWLNPSYQPECRARYALDAFETVQEKLFWISPPPGQPRPATNAAAPAAIVAIKPCEFAPQFQPVYEAPPVLAERPAPADRQPPAGARPPASAAVSTVRDMRDVLALPATGRGSDGPAGIRGADCVTAFNTPLSVGATFDPQMAARYGDLMGRDFHDAGYNSQLGPDVDIIRTWRFGRATEGYGEDPYLTGQIAGPLVRSIAGNHVVSMMKHYAVYAQEQGRVGDQPSGMQPAVNNVLSERAMREIYLPGFKAAVQVGGAGQIMCSFPRVNGIYACENAHLFEILKGEWGFDGTVGPDFPSAQRSIVPAFMAGLDSGRIVSDAGTFAGQMGLAEAVAQGVVPEARLDDIILRRLIPQFRIGVYENPAHRIAPDVSTPERRAALADIVTAGAVLLRNENDILPFGPGVRSIAVIGAQATERAQVVEQGSAIVNVDHLDPVLPAIQRRAGDQIAVSFAQGTFGLEPLSAVPASYFSTPDGRPGVQARYYGNPNFDYSSEPVAEETRAGLDLAGVPADLNLPANQQWTGVFETLFTPTRSGVQKFSLHAGGSVKLFVNGELVGRTERADFGDSIFATADAAAGEPLQLRIEYTPRAALAPVPTAMFGANGGTQLAFGYAPPDTMIADAARAAAQADVAVVFVGHLVGEGMDRTSLSLPNDQNALIAAVAAANPRTVVVLNTGGPVIMPWLNSVAGVLEMWLPGDVIGDAAAQLLFGDAEPSGRLPVTFPADENQGPASRQYQYPGTLDSAGRLDTAWFDEGIYVGYRYWDKFEQEPLFPFGFGLSYTSFAASGYALETHDDGSATVSLQLSNTGDRAGSEVVQVYIGFPETVDAPPRQLRGFAKVSLEPGTSDRVEIGLAADAFTYWDENLNGWKRAEGEYTVSVGSSSRDIDWQTTLPETALRSLTPAQ